MSTPSVQVETRGAVALVTLNRPDSANTLNLEMGMDLLAAAAQAVTAEGTEGINAFLEKRTADFSPGRDRPGRDAPRRDAPGRVSLGPDSPGRVSGGADER